MWIVNEAQARLMHKYCAVSSSAASNTCPGLGREAVPGLTGPRQRSVSRPAWLLERRVQQALRGLSIANLHVGTREVRKQNDGNSILGDTDVYHARLHFMVSLH